MTEMNNHPNLNPFPAAAELSFRSGPSGGHGGQPFELRGEPGRQPIGVVVRHDGLIDALGLIWAEGEDTLMAGGTGGTTSRVVFTAAETLVRIRGRHGAHLDFLELTSSHGQVWTFGGDGGQHEFAFEVPTGMTLVGLFGRAGRFIDALGILVTPDKGLSRSKPAPKKRVPRVVKDDVEAAPAIPVKRKSTEKAEVVVEASEPAKKSTARRSRKATIDAQGTS